MYEYESFKQELFLCKQRVLISSRRQTGFTLLKKEEAGFTFARKQTGFTLIEILVVFSVVAILAGVGIASFVTYSRSQEVNQAANNIKLLVSEAKFNSLSVVKTVSDNQGQQVTCGAQSLVGYRIDVVQPRTLNLTQVCDLNSAIVKSIQLPATVSFSTGTSCLQVQFSSLSANATGVPCDIQIAGPSDSKTVSIDAIGNVSIN